MPPTPEGLIATLILPAPRGSAASAAHDEAAARTPARGGGAPTAAAHATPATQASAPHAPAHPAASHPAAPTEPEPATGGLLVSLAQLRAIMTHLAQSKATRYIAPLNQALGEFHIVNRLRKAAFLGQVAHESGELAWFQEFASGMEYDISQRPAKAKELGNVNPGDGPRYKGRGPIQLTGRNNYRACGKALGLDLEGHPEMAIEPGVAFRTAGWFWETHGLNTLADKSDYREITRRINGGYTHYDERLKYYELALKVLPPDPR